MCSTRKQRKNNNFKFLIIENKAIGRLHFRKTYTNVFLTLTDAFNKVVGTMSGGRATPSNSKRLKKAAHMMYPLIMKFKKTFDQHNLQCFEIILKSRGGWYIKTMIDALKSENYSIEAIVDKKLRPHNGVRARKARRI